ncbi:unnamed protein product [Aureobasidium mustum]|uniref:Uncharacterized protein n=1 Tax=Aureobasidium mustum TaxID=2773714 RepID=A0A9N8JS11_9PEZI|nr:unnamed protein product [Aureobasidium mustum]
MSSPANHEMAVLRVRILARLSPAARALVDPLRSEFDDHIARGMLAGRLCAHWAAESAARNPERAVVLYKAHLRNSLHHERMRLVVGPVARP